MQTKTVYSVSPNGDKEQVWEFSGTIHVDFIGDDTAICETSDGDDPFGVEMVYNGFIEIS